MRSRFDPWSGWIGSALGFLLVFGTVSTGCGRTTGQDLPPGLMSFPIAIELSLDEDAEGEPKYLYVTSSNFALQWNSGNVQSYDLDKVLEAIQTGCIGAGVANSCLRSSFEGNINEPECVCDPVNDDDCTAIPPDRCSVVPSNLRFRDPGAALRLIPVDGLIPGEVSIGSFSDGMGLSTDGRRIYIPVRSDSNLTFIDVNEEGQLSCGGAFGEPHTCTSPYRSGSAELVNPSLNLGLPPDPVDVYVGDLAADFGDVDGSDDAALDGDYILMAHREGRASMFFDQFRPGGPEPQQRPRLAATLDDLAPEQVTITYEPGAKRAWIPSAEVPAIVRVGIAVDEDPTQSYLFDAGLLFVSGLDQGRSNRDIRFDPREGRNLAYIVSRSPEALIVARSDVAGGDLNMVAQIPTCGDPSRVQIAEVPARGDTVVLAFVSCFLSRNVQVVDTDSFQGLTTLTNVSGAFEFVIDAPRRLLYVADFSTSVIRVADLQPILDCLESTGAEEGTECAPRLLGLVGLPQPVAELPR
ncbi:MAG: hypothetical protein KJO40_06875 [Deltaproteobacteria bacterium]|nr:hypothetical protein [Deltaproteobacteria bacterium]NNK06330.1 hypothetical protein [Myxococcales bacterium]MBT8463773.1 hypothetical protein [Deltaproteobacteria bacterium]MBT8483142.1 hypothetical protein [Deltaproteobacteria bacterium]NNK42425.1 hypothetical protein [Myxococcales bacterium]